MKKIASTRQLLITFVPSLLILVALLVVRVRFQVDMSVMTRDIAAVGNIHPLAGVLSQLGLLVWCATASICALAAVLLRDAKPDASRFLMYSAILSGYLLFDDGFQFHEALAPRYFHLSEKLVYVALGIAVVAYLISFRRLMFRTNFGVLALAMVFLSGSVFIDQILEKWMWRRIGDWEYFFEDGAKWLGIVSWCSYYVDTSYLFIVNTIGKRSESDARPSPKLIAIPGTAREDDMAAVSLQDGRRPQRGAVMAKSIPG